MKDMLVRNKNNKFGLKFKLLLGALALAVIAGLGIAVQAAQEDVDNETDLLLLYRQTALFNPFTLNTRTLSTPMNLSLSDSGAITLDEPIRIAVRPPKRTPGKPYWVPGPPPWHKFK